MPAATMTLAAERRAKVAAAMAKAGLDVLAAYGNGWQGDYLMYVSGFAILEGHGLAVLDRDGACTLYLDNATEVERAAAQLSGTDVRWSRSIGREVAAACASRGTTRVGAAPFAFLPYGFVAAAVTAVEDATALLDACLMHKTPGEIACVRRSAEAADDAYVVFREAAREGRRQYEVVADVEASLRERGVPENFMLLGSGGTDVRSVTPPSNRTLARGDLVITELTPSIEGYYAQICRTLVIGRASDAQRRAFATYVEALEAGIAGVKPGATAADVARAENDVFRRHGLGEYVTSAYTRVRGHGLGLFADSKPHVLENVDVPLEPGMTLVVHPNTYHPEVGYIMLGDSVVVTETGVEVLTRTARTLFESDV